VGCDADSVRLGIEARGTQPGLRPGPARVSLDCVARWRRIRRDLGAGLVLRHCIDRILVSSKTSSLVGVVAAQAEAGGEGTFQFVQPREGALTAAIPVHLEAALAGDLDLDLVAFPEAQGFDDRCGQTDRQRVAPLLDPHARPSLNLHALTDSSKRFGRILPASTSLSERASNFSNAAGSWLSDPDGLIVGLLSAADLNIDRIRSDRQTPKVVVVRSRSDEAIHVARVGDGLLRLRLAMTALSDGGS
jgi:hypothetical protein